MPEMVLQDHFTAMVSPLHWQEIYGPFGVTIDTGGNLYIQDLFNRRIRKVYASGIITTVAGNGIAAYSRNGGPALAASFYDATGFAIDRIGNYYISDLWYSVIRKVNTLTLSAEEVSAGIRMKSQAFPNPNRGVFMVRSIFNTKSEENITIEITNMLGQVVYTHQTKSIEGNVNEEVWLPNEPAGMYILMVKGERESNMIKFVIEK
jgi:internalin A